MKVLHHQTGAYEDANRLITILNLLTHRAGFTYGEFQTGHHKVLGGDIDSERTAAQWIQGLAGLPLVSQPGEICNHGKSTGVWGLLIAAIEGKSLGQVMAEKIFTSVVNRYKG